MNNNSDYFGIQIINSLSSGLIAVNADLDVFIFNKEAENITGIIADEILGKQLKDFEGLAALHNIFAETLANTMPITRAEINIIPENMITDTDITIVVGVTTDLIWHDRQENIVGGVVGNFRDISEILSLKNKLRREDRLMVLGKMAAGVAHEIRNPITVIKGLAELLKKEYKNPTEDSETYFSKINSEVLRIDRLITEILDFSADIKLQKNKCNLITILNDIIENEFSVINKKNANLQTDFTSAKLMIELDEYRIKQVIINMLENAVDAVDNESGNIAISCDIKNVNVIIKIVDNGEGIEKTDLDNIFLPFFTKKSHKGTGLGLSISKRIVELHKGKINIASQKGEGTTVEIMLPVGNNINRK